MTENSGKALLRSRLGTRSVVGQNNEISSCGEILLDKPQKFVHNNFMDRTPDMPLIADPKRLLLDMARERCRDGLLRMVVERLAQSPAVALARIWLIRPGEGCATCPMQAECPDRTTCLHLVASAGQSQSGPDQRYDRLDGAFRRFPIGVRKVGKIAQMGTPIEVPDFETSSEWIVYPEWTRAEAIRGFGGQPLVHRGEVLGVLAVFSRIPIGPISLDWLRMIADHAAAAIANTRAWAEIESLRTRLELENAYLQEELEACQPFGELVGSSAALRAVAGQVALVAPTDATVLITGESGTGKELVAREVHRRSARAGRPLIKVNCAAIPEQLFESELFGHVRGAFTGAVRDRTGRFELADGGTLFLDEVGEIPPLLQGKLLRVLQEGEFERIGEERTRRVDVRIVAATNRCLKKDVASGVFRSDLFYRLAVFPIELVPLRDRPEDIAVLAEHFVRELAQRHRRTVPQLTRAHLQRLRDYSWPGNARELQHVLERSLISSPSGQLSLGTLPTGPVSLSVAGGPTDPVPLLTEDALRTLERENLKRALALTEGRIHGPGGAADLLGIKPTTLASRIKSFGIRLRRVAD